MRDERSLTGHRFMIAKKRKGRHPLRKGGKRGRVARIEPRASTSSDGREVCGPGQYPVHELTEARFAHILGRRIDARAERDRRQLLGLRERLDDRRALTLHLDIGKLEREKR